MNSLPLAPIQAHFLTNFTFTEFYELCVARKSTNIPIYE